MGITQSSEDASHVSSPEQLSYILAERFATKCFTPLELTHFKDNFFTRATDQGGLQYWNEKILSDFLAIPDSSDSHCPLDAGPVIFRMVSYLGAFPFQNSLAPSVLTFEALVKVAVLLTERYGKVLRRGRKDRIRLLFGSLADVGRREVELSSPKKDNTGDEESKSHAPGFDIDAPANDNYDEEEEDDDLALAALESLDAIEVFKHDSRIDRAVYEARISVKTFRRLLMLLLVIAPLRPLEEVGLYTSDFNGNRMEAIRKEADHIMEAFHQEPSGGIGYKTFATTIATSFPYLFDPLTPLFEHLLFSKNLDLSQKRESDPLQTPITESGEVPQPSPLSIMLAGSFDPLPARRSSLTIDVSLETANFHVSPIGHDGVFLPSGTAVATDPATKTHIDIYTLEIWGLVPDPEVPASEQGQSAVEIQQAKWEFEAQEAERRRNLNLKAGAGDSAAESARWLLETAGLIGDNGGRAGGSV
ncbi:hypothetical protein ARAM_006708 [Aspergillus rambellii]|uniref:Restriction of telomere capping protein 5 n=1 Tax=Aspergillus rambellii TaxID=308745 RepID=A0A0F8V0E9_9EURO|nr:hypothetical protein ARAM_006708 [Aspergillus rambellii]